MYCIYFGLTDAYFALTRVGRGIAGPSGAGGGAEDDGGSSQRSASPADDLHPGADLSQLRQGHRQGRAALQRSVGHVWLEIEFCFGELL